MTFQLQITRKADSSMVGETSNTSLRSNIGEEETTELPITYQENLERKITESSVNARKTNMTQQQSKMIAKFKFDLEAKTSFETRNWM